MTHVREVSILCSDQVRPVARGHIGLLFISPLIADAVEDMSHIAIRIRDLRIAGLDREQGHESKRQKAGALRSKHS